MPRILVAIALLLFARTVHSAAQATAQSASPPGSSEYESDWGAFEQEVDEKYAFFKLKGIAGDWREAKPALRKRVASCASQQEFLEVVRDAIFTLRDAHMRIVDVKGKAPDWPKRYHIGVTFTPAADGRVVVMGAARKLAKRLPTGTVVTKIDGKDAREVLERRAREAWKRGGPFSSPQRARMFEYRLPLRGDKGRRHTITCVSRGGKARRLTLPSAYEAVGWQHTYNRPGDLKRVGRSIFYTRLDGDIAYVYLRRIDRSVKAGLDKALADHGGMKGWIIDLRGNGGGGYRGDLIQRIKTFPRPTAVLIDAGCMSAGETLARDFRRYADARLFGSPTAGASSAKRRWRFPSGRAAVVLATRSRWRADGKPIEFNGIQPDERVEAVPKELARGENSCILRAKAYLLRKVNKRCQDPFLGRSRCRRRLAEGRTQAEEGLNPHGRMRGHAGTIPGRYGRQPQPLQLLEVGLSPTQNSKP